VPKAEVETFRAELGSAGAERRPIPARAQQAAPAIRNQEPAQVSEFQPKGFRLAEVQAQVAREAAAESNAAEADRKPVTLADVQQQLAKEGITPTRPVAFAPAAAPRPTVEAPPKVIPAQPVLEARIEKPVPQAPQVKIDAPVEPPVVDLKPQQLAPKATGVATSLETIAKPIISPLASRQVAAAFGELSEAFAARSKKTFDEMAEQMLRPMLQEWLDNNLPVLVERLVREEIERVARGA
jgi:cell pole-organizing protein PopZ